MKIEIKSTDVEIFEGTSRNTGKPFSMRKQIGYVFLPTKAYPVEMKITLNRDQTPYPVGFFTIHPDSFGVGRFGDLEIQNLRLVPVTAAVNKAS